MRIITAVSVIGTAFVLARTRYRLNQWKRQLDTFEAQLLSQPVTKKKTTEEEWNDLPPVVQRYLDQALPQSHASIAHVRFHQVGSYAMGEDSRVRVHAEELLSTHGLVWDASIAVVASWPHWPSIQTCDAYLPGGKGYRRSAWLQTPLVDVVFGTSSPTENDSDLVQSQALRWLGETPLLPTVLNPSEGVVTWTADSDTTATLHLQELSLLATFDETTGLLERLDGPRPYWNGSAFVTRQWVGTFSKYEPHVDGMLVPTHIQSGFQDGEEEVVWTFQLENVSMEFDMLSPPPPQEQPQDDIHTTTAATA